MSPPSVKARLAESLNAATNPDSGQPERKQINHPGQRATPQARKKRELPPAPIRQRARNEASPQRHNRKDPDNEADRMIGPAQIVTNMRSQSRQHGSHPHKSQKRRAD